MTQEQEIFLKKFAALQYPGSRDNLGTGHPMHKVQTYSPDYEDVATTTDNPENLVVVTEEGTFRKLEYYVLSQMLYSGFSADSSDEEFDTAITEYNEAADTLTPIVPFDLALRECEIPNDKANDGYIGELRDYLSAYGLDDDDPYMRVCREIPGWRDVGIFFTLDEAKRYIQYQGHNLTNPRTYTFGAAYGDKGDYIPLWEFLYEQGKELLEQENCHCIFGEAETKQEGVKTSISVPVYADAWLLGLPGETALKGTMQINLQDYDEKLPEVYGYGTVSVLFCGESDTVLYQKAVRVPRDSARDGVDLKFLRQMFDYARYSGVIYKE